MKRTLNVFFVGDNGFTPFDNADTVNFDAATNSWIVKHTGGREDSIIPRENIKFMHAVLTPLPVEEAEVDDEVIILPPRKKKNLAEVVNEAVEAG